MSAELVSGIATRVLLPLVAGGELRPLPPIGSRRAVAALEHAAFASSLLDELRARRLRVARKLTPVDALGDPTPAEWLMACALNDLLQSTNATLLGPFGGDRPQRLLQMTLATLERAGVPRTVGEALSRHATFSRLLEIVRIDTHVSWWVGSQVFHGMRPPARLLAWPNVRRVRERQDTVQLVDMSSSSEGAHALYEETLRTLLAASPLTDLSTAGRDVVPFRWTGASLSLIASAGGQRLALRALERARAPKRALRAVSDLPAKLARGTTPEAARASLAVSALALELQKRLGLSAVAADDAPASAAVSPPEPA